jgi:hypothetical protein
MRIRWVRHVAYVTKMQKKSENLKERDLSEDLGVAGAAEKRAILKTIN